MKASAQLLRTRTENIECTTVQRDHCLNERVEFCESRRADEYSWLKVNYVNGTTTYIRGPKMMFIVPHIIESISVQKIEEVQANEREYLKVKYLDGSTQHVCGPTSMQRIPTTMLSIRVHKAIEVKFGEAIVVYTHLTDPNDVKAPAAKMSREIKYGPLLFFPEVNQSLHNFSWHGSNKVDHPSQTRVLANARKFTHLKLLQEQLYYNVRDVSTICDSKLTIKLMLVFCIKDAEKMLDNTNDPIGEMVNALCADIIEWAAGRTYEATLNETGQLSKLEKYPRLQECSVKVGVDIHSICYRGYKGEPNPRRANALKRRLEIKLRQEEAESAGCKRINWSRKSNVHRASRKRPTLRPKQS